MFEVFCCDAFEGLLWIVLLESSRGLTIGDWGMLNWTMGFWEFLFRLGCILCLIISSVFWFWLGCIALLRPCWRGGYNLYTGSYCCSLRGAWQITCSSGSDNHACLSSIVYGLSWKEMHMNDWGFFVWVSVVVVGSSWDVVGGNWRGACWLAILKDLKKIIYLWRNFMFIIILFVEKNQKDCY